MKIQHTKYEESRGHTGSHLSVTVNNLKHNGLEDALKKFRKRVEKYEIIETYKEYQTYTKPSVLKHKLKKKQTYNSKLKNVQDK